MAQGFFAWHNRLRFGDRAISAALTALVLTSLLPILAFSVGLAWLFIENTREDAEASLQSVTRALSIAVDRELQRHLSVLETLTVSRSLDSGDLSTYEDLANRVVALQPTWLDLGLLDARTKTLLSSTQPMPETPVRTVAPDAFDRVVETQKPVVVGAFPAAKVVKRPSVRLMVPVVRDGAVRYVLSGLVNPAVFSDLFKEQRLPASWIGAVLDSRLTIAGRSRDDEGRVGTPVLPSLAGQIARGNTRLFRSVTDEGDQLYAVASRSELSGWHVVLGIPEKEIDGPIARVFLGIVVSGGAFAALAFVLAGVLGRRIVARRLAYERVLHAKANELESANRKLAELSASDSLTGLANRRRFDEVLTAEWFRARRAGRAIALLMIDVDFFKPYNDEYGHQAGDLCLQMVAGVLKATTRRASDLAVRFGGDEFCVIATELEPEAAEQLAQTVQRHAAALDIRHERSPYGAVTLSIGAATLHPHAANSIEDLIRLADAALYEAKRRGRNRICMAPPAA